MSTFAEYVEKRKTRELAELCVRHDIDLQPLVERLDRLCRTGLPPEQIYREFMQQAANMVGNLAGRAVGGIGNMVNSFGQGYQQGKGQQAGMGQRQQASMAGQSQQQGTNQQQGNVAAAANTQQAIMMLQNLKQNLQALSQGNQNLSKNLLDFSQVTDKIAQAIQQSIT